MKQSSLCSIDSKETERGKVSLLCVMKAFSLRLWTLILKSTWKFILNSVSNIRVFRRIIFISDLTLVEKTQFISCEWNTFPCSKPPPQTLGKNLSTGEPSRLPPIPEYTGISTKQEQKKVLIDSVEKFKDVSLHQASYGFSITSQCLTMSIPTWHTESWFKNFSSFLSEFLARHPLLCLLLVQPSCQWNPPHPVLLVLLSRGRP